MNPASWRSQVDIPIRLMILRKTQEIFETIQVPCDSEVFAKTLDVLIPKLEKELYRTAASLEEYGNPKTVEQRLARMAPWHVQLKPLEALWLQGLLATTNAPSIETGDRGIGGCLDAAAAAPSAPDPRTNPRDSMPLMVSLELTRAQPRNRSDDRLSAPTTTTSSGPSSHLQGTSSPPQNHPRDRYTQSLIELYQFLKHYDDVSNRTETEDFSSSETGSAVFASALGGGGGGGSSTSGAIDLRCHEQLDDSSHNDEDMMQP